MREIWDAAQAGDLERAREIDAELRPIYEALAVTTNPIPVKAALEMLGLIAGRTAAADGPGDAEQRAAVSAALERHRPLLGGSTSASELRGRRSSASCRSAASARSART